MHSYSGAANTREIEAAYYPTVPLFTATYLSTILIQPDNMLQYCTAQICHTFDE